MKALLALIKKLYGSKALSKTIGTRTNVITLPDKDTKRFITNELNVDAASDAAIEKAYKDVEKLIPEIPKMNDQEILTFTGNLRRLDQRMNPPSAEVIEFGTKQPVSPAGIKQLAAEKGLPEDVDPNSPLGRIMQRVNKVRIEGKDLAKEFGMEDQLKKGLDDLMGMQKGYPNLQREGMVRTAAREILEKNLKEGKLKLTDPTEAKMISESGQGGVDPIEVFRREYGEGALEQLDDIADEILPAQSYKEITDVLKREKLFDLKPISAEQKAAEKASSEAAEKVMKDVREGKIKTLTDEPEDFAQGGRVGYQEGGNIYTAYNNYLSELQNRAAGDLSIPIMNMMSTQVSDGNSEQNQTVTTNPVASAFNPTMMDMLGIAVNPVLGIANLASRTQTGLSLAQRAADMFGIGRGPGGRTAGFGVDSMAGMASGPTHGVDAVNEGSVGADASAGGAAGAAAASAAGSNDGPGGGTFAEGGRVGYAYGSGLKLIKLLKDKGKTLTKAIQEAVDNIMPTGDRKLDADMAVDDMFENLGIDRDAVDQKDVLDAYDQAYQLITKPGPDVPAATTTAKIEGLKSLGLDPSDFPDIPDDAISFASPKSQIAQPMSKEMIVSKYGDMIDDELMAKILTDDDPQRIAEVLATIDEAMTMQNKGMGSEEIISTIKKTPRTKQAGGGLAYLMGL